MKNINIRKLTIASLLCSLLIISAYISIPVPILAIKITLQTMIIFIIGAILPPSYAFFSIALYILLGLSGLPVFSSGSGPMYIFSPSFGFLMGFAVATPIMAMINGIAFGKHIFRYALASFVGLAIIYLLGVPYLYYILKVYMGNNIKFSYALIYGGLMFLPFDAFKSIIAYPIVSIIKKSVKRI